MTELLLAAAYLVSVVAIAGLTGRRSFPSWLRSAFTVWCQPVVGVFVFALTARSVITR